MKIEFHYYITYLIAARAGIRGDDLRILAHASQLTDDNDIVYRIKDSGKIIYKNQISQTMQLIKSRAGRLEVYPLFHFIPGVPNTENAKRRDGKTHPFNTTPNSPNANRIIDETLETGNFYEIGIAIHAYVDTWAHQNFAGCKNSFNKFSGFVDKLIPNIGHADAKTMPDQPRLVWEDERLVNSTVNNKERFLEAAACLFEKLRKMADPECSPKTLEADRSRLLADLSTAIGSNRIEVDPSIKRLGNYRKLAAMQEYGGTEIPDYNADQWFRHAVRKTVRRVGNRAHGRQKRIVTFNFKPDHEVSDWFRFQEAVKAYAERSKTILCDTPEIAVEYNA
ncbi:MAG: DUF6765 family protein [Kiritimatiellia bacterium]